MTLPAEPVTTVTAPRILIVGGVAGGASAAARLRRLSESAQVTILERGEHVSFANCGLPYHIAGAIADRSRLLVQTPASLRNRFALDVRVQTEVLAIDRAARTLTVRDRAANRAETLPYDYLILSPGAEPIRPALPGIDSPRVLTLRSMADMDRINQRLAETSVRHALVIGGGYIGLEMAEALRQRNVAVTLVELAPQVMNVADPEMATPLHDELRRHGVDLRLGTSITAFRDDPAAIAATLADGSILAADLVILAIGVRPEVTLAKNAGLTLGPRGGIAVDEHQRTSDERIYAVGDAAEVIDFATGAPALIPLAGPANRQGRIAADNILGRPRAYRKTQGTAICKVFDLAIAMTGASEKALQRLHRAYQAVYVHPNDHASYYPGAHQLSLKLLFDPTDGKVLGAQAVGPLAAGVDKRIDVLAVALRAGMTVFDLEELELAYAPPFNSAKDPVNYAGFVAANVIRGDVKLCTIADLRNPAENQAILDVRTPAEFTLGSIPNAVNIPVDDLRTRLAELPRDKEYLVTCAVGLRGYLACRILTQHGYTCRNFSGGYKTWRMFHPPIVTPILPKEPTMPNAAPTSPAPSASTTPCGIPACPPPSRVHDLDATGLMCPGPIMQLKTAIDAAAPGEAVRIRVTDAGFLQDIPAWCASTGHQLASITSAAGTHTATVLKSPAPAPIENQESKIENINAKTLVVFSGDLDKVLASFVIANGAAAMGSQVTMFFTFWGLNALRRQESVAVPKNLIEKMFGWMMPRGATRLTLSKMHMAGMGTAMIKGIMKKHRVPALEDMIASARHAGVRLVACTMSMELMGIKQAELIDGVEPGGVALYLNQAEHAGVNLFI